MDATILEEAADAGPEAGEAGLPQRNFWNTVDRRRVDMILLRFADKRFARHPKMDPRDPCDGCQAHIAEQSVRDIHT